MTITVDSATRADVLAARALVAMGDAAGRTVDPRTREVAKLDPVSRPSRTAAQQQGFQVGDEYRGIVVRIAGQTVIVRLTAEHEASMFLTVEDIRTLAGGRYVERTEDALSVGDPIEVEVIGVDGDRIEVAPLLPAVIPLDLDNGEAGVTSGGRYGRPPADPSSNEPRF